MSSKTHHTAVAVIPPQVWEPIQSIRRQHDRQFHRWMPHINLLYPFHPPEQFNESVPRLVDVCSKIGRFEVTLLEFRCFVHPSRSATLWLVPEPNTPLVEPRGSDERLSQLR